MIMDLKPLAQYNKAQTIKVDNSTWGGGGGGPPCWQIKMVMVPTISLVLLELSPSNLGSTLGNIAAGQRSASSVSSKAPISKVGPFLSGTI